MSGLAVMALALTLASCPQQATTGDRSEGAHIHVAPPVSTVTMAPTAEPVVSAEPLSPGERPPRTGAPGSTTGTVSCGKIRCEAPGEVCGWDEKKAEWACAARSDLEEVPSQAWPYACDDGSDCPAGQACCVEWSNEHFEGRSCMPRENANSNCVYEMCMANGAACPTGRTCSVVAAGLGDNTALEGTCDAPPGIATCANKKKCPAKEPVCVATGKGYVCAAEGSPVHEKASGEERYECTRPSDCNAGEQCQTSFGENPGVATFCGAYSMPYRATLICDPATWGSCKKGEECNWVCERSKGRPPWMGFMRRKE